jgi:methyl-accepting chemotaxis protein
MDINLRELLSLVTSNSFVWLYCGLILLIFLWCILRFWWLVNPIQKQMKEACNKLNESERDKNAFPAKFYEFKDWIVKQKYLADAWREYEETLLIPGEDFEDNRDVILNTHLTAVYFNQKSILWHHIDMRFYNALPNILTGLGIVGTFLGLSVGIYLASPGLNSDNINDAKDALSVLLDGAALAFTTSIVGLLSSLVFSFYEKKKIHKFVRFCQTLVSEIDARVEYFSAERLANKSLEESKKQSNALQTFANDLAVTLGQVIEQQVTAPMVNAINDLRNDQKAASDETLEKLISEFAQSISGAAGEEMKAFATTVETMGQHLESQVNTLTKGQDDMQKASAQAVSDMSEAVLNGSKKINEGIDEAVAALTRSVAKSMESVSQQLEKASTNLADKLKSSVSEFDVLINKFKDINQEYDTLTSQNQELLKQMSESLNSAQQLIVSTERAHGSFLQSADQFEDLTKSISQSAQKVADSNENIDAAIGQIVTIQEQVKTTWQDYKERFTDMDSSLEGVFVSINNGLDNYAQKTDEYVLGLDKHASEVVQSLAAAVQDIAESVESLKEGLEDRSGEFESAIGDISTQAKRNLDVFKHEMSQLTPQIEDIPTTQNI